MVARLINSWLAKLLAERLSKVNPLIVAFTVEAGLIIRNRQRKTKGLALVKTLFEGCSEALI